jgi:DNA-binding protein HU-beta
LTGFGTFSVRERPARTGHNPKTGEPMEIKASKAPVFKAGKTLKDAIK